MSTDLSSYVPLKEVVGYVLDANGKSMKDFDKCWLIAFRGLAYMGLQAAFELKTIRIPVKSNKTAPFPRDYIMWSKIGILNQSGEMSCLKINNSLSKFKDTNPNRIERLTPDVTDSWLDNFPNFPYFINYYMNGYYTPLFGIGNGVIHYGSCTVDEKNRVVVLDPDFAFDHIMFEYVYAPQQDSDYQIQLCLQEALIAWCEWKLKLGPEQTFWTFFKGGRRSLPGNRMTEQEISTAIRAYHGYKLKS